MKDADLFQIVSQRGIETKHYPITLAGWHSSIVVCVKCLERWPCKHNKEG